MKIANLFNTGDIEVLCLGAHCDDIEIGCGGTLLRLQKEYPRIRISWVIFNSDDSRSIETRASAARFLKKDVSFSIDFERFRDGYFPFEAIKIKKYFERLKTRFDPDLIFTHFKKDLHQDHRLISEMTWATFRRNFILEYEVPKYDGDFGSPNLFIQLDEDICRKKVDILLNSYPSQAGKHWFSDGVFWSLMTLRGMESRSATSYSEAFYCRKLVI